MKIKHTLFHSLLGITCLCLATACNSDDDAANSISGANTNRNNPATACADRLEIPRLKEGGNNLFLVHSVSTYGVNMCIEWDCDKKAQRWTAYQMYASNSVVNWNRNNWPNGDPFQEDTAIPEQYRTTLADYRRTGYNRGHICASADRLCSKDANEQTFFLSNMQPQVYAFNAGTWEKMEEKVRSWNNNSFRDTLYVVKGGTIDRADQLLSPANTGLLVPKYFFMAILCKNQDPSQYGYKALGFWIEHKANSDTDLKKYTVSIDELEEKTGIDFFCNLPDQIEDAVERNLVPSVWGFR
ncbi:MAG: DNA/RNA non-specific endonuclease [Clostridium sp.]|nr:DNA/RNA non-specific endonuclease [Clostridium sp.]